MADIIVVDEDLAALAERYKTFAALFELQLSDYVAVLSNITGSAIQEGHTYENIETFKTAVGMLQGNILHLTTNLDSWLDTFLEDVESNDHYVD
jgi:hypothetical protein